MSQWPIRGLSLLQSQNRGLSLLLIDRFYLQLSVRPVNPR
jgi:hypothetical protein